MRLKWLVEVTYGDDKKEKFTCSDSPAVNGDWIILFYDDGGRKWLKANTVIRVEAGTKK